MRAPMLIVAGVMLLTAWACPAACAGIEFEERSIDHARESQQRVTAAEHTTAERALRRTPRLERLKTEREFEERPEQRFLDDDQPSPKPRARLRDLALRSFESKNWLQRPKLRRSTEIATDALVFKRPPFTSKPPTLTEVPDEAALQRIRHPYVYVPPTADFKGIRQAFIDKNSDQLVLLRKSNRNIEAALASHVTGVRVLHGLPNDTEGALEVHGRFGADVPLSAWSYFRDSLAATSSNVVDLGAEKFFSNGQETQAAALKRLLSSPASDGTIDVVVGHSSKGQLKFADGSTISVSSLSRAANHSVIFLTCRGLTHVEPGGPNAINMAQLDNEQADGPVLVGAGRNIEFNQALEILRRIQAATVKKPHSTLKDVLLELQRDPVTRVLGGVAAEDNGDIDMQRG